MIIERESTKDDSNDDNSNNKGTIIVEAICAPSDVYYPQDLTLLNKSRKSLEKIIDDLHKNIQDKKPRTYRQVARKEFLKISQARRKTYKNLRKAIRIYNRDFCYINSMSNDGLLLTDKQKEMFHN